MHNRTKVDTRIHQFRYICEDCGLDKVARMKLPAGMTAEQRKFAINDTAHKMYQAIRGKLGCHHPNEISYRNYDQSLVQ